MADIALTDLTALTNGLEGTGVFDQLMKTVSAHVQEQYEKDRISTTDYATVYLGALQSTLSESIKFLMTEQEAAAKAELIQEQIKSEVKNNEPGGLIDLQKQKLQEEIDLVISKTAESYESIQASQQRTTRENLLNSKVVTKTEKETEMLTQQIAELLLTGPLERLLLEAKTDATNSGAVDNTNKTNAEVALLDARADEQLIDTTRKTTRNTSEVALIDAKTTEQLAATTRLDSESVEKVLLLKAQTVGFKTDAKQKLLKQMMDGVAVNTTTSGSVFNSNIVSDQAVKDVANDILDDLTSAVNI